MMKQNILVILLIIISVKINAQSSLSQDNKKKRLDFAQTYFELGGKYYPSFKGKSLDSEIDHSATVNPYLSWGGFHFWGHAEFYVTFPFAQLNLDANSDTDFELKQAVVTGARYLPWAYEERKLRPYVGLSWSSISFKQSEKSNDDQPLQFKDFMLVPDVGLMYGYKAFTLRLGVNYMKNNKWDYPLSKTDFREIKTSKLNFQLGLIYSFENSYHKEEEISEKWNSYPTISNSGHGATRSGDFFIGIGPTTSFSLKKSSYNQSELPYLQDKISSSNFYDISIGYQWNKLGIFSAVSFRNPEFKTEGFGTTQTINKRSVAIEVNKFITDYSGFTPFIGINVAMDEIKYKEESETSSRELTFNRIEPGITLGWDILPGKTDEFLILRTNLRWYPFSSFKIDDKKFDFSQLEYNLIQLVFFPDRLKRSKSRK